VNIRIPWLGSIGVIVVAIGLLLGYAKRTHAYPGLIILAGCVACVVFLMANELATTRSHRMPHAIDSGTPSAASDSPNSRT
jgi:hypothetical protein